MGNILLKKLTKCKYKNKIFIELKDPKQWEESLVQHFSQDI